MFHYYDKYTLAVATFFVSRYSDRKTAVPTGSTHYYLQTTREDRASIVVVPTPGIRTARRKISQINKKNDDPVSHQGRLGQEAPSNYVLNMYKIEHSIFLIVIYSK